MFPLLINTIPENGSENVGLDQQISLEFSADLSTDLSQASIRLVNMNDGTEVEGIAPSVDSSFLRISVPANATGGHSYEGLTQYKLLVSSIESLPGEEMEGTLELRFTTEANEVQDYPYEEPEVLSDFYVARSYPEENSVGTPTTLRIKTNKDIGLSTDLDHIYLVEGKSVEDALFMGNTNLLSPEDISINSDIISITCPELGSATQYTLSIESLTSIDSDTIEPFSISFISSFDSMYADVEEILKSKAVTILLEGAQEVEIARLIDDNGKLAEFMVEKYATEDIDWTNPPIYVEQYVKYKTQYDIVFDKFIELSGNPTSKQLKDLTIEYGYSLGDLLDLADKLELRYKYWEEFLKSSGKGRASAGVFQKGSNVDENPDFMDRKFTSIEGDKEW